MSLQSIVATEIRNERQSSTVKSQDELRQAEVATYIARSIAVDLWLLMTNTKLLSSNLLGFGGAEINNVQACFEGLDMVLAALARKSPVLILIIRKSKQLLVPGSTANIIEATPTSW